MSNPKLIILAGGNGSGKTTLYEKIVKNYCVEFLNADMHLKESGKEQTPENMKISQEFIRDSYTDRIAKRNSFCFETVFSHESKLDLITEAKKQGFHVILIYVHLESVDLNVARVRQRTGAGGHDVPEGKIRARVARTFNHMKTAKTLVDEMAIYDNTHDMKNVCKMKNSIVVSKSNTPPGWLTELLDA